MAAKTKKMANVKKSPSSKRKLSAWFSKSFTLGRMTINVWLVLVIALAFGTAGVGYEYLSHAASNERYIDVPAWNLNVHSWYTITFNRCIYNSLFNCSSSYGSWTHQMYITSEDSLTGRFTALGCYLNCNNGWTWYASGSVRGDAIGWHAQYYGSTYAFDVDNNLSSVSTSNPLSGGRAYIYGYSHAPNGLFQLFTVGGAGASRFPHPNWNINWPNMMTMKTYCRLYCSGNYTFTVNPTVNTGYFDPNGNGYFSGTIRYSGWLYNWNIEGRITGDDVNYVVYDPYGSYSSQGIGSFFSGVAGCNNNTNCVTDTSGHALQFSWGSAGTW